MSSKISKKKSKVKLERMKYLDYCRAHNWNVVPIQVELREDVGKFLENGEQKILKSIKCGFNMNDFENTALIKSRWSEFKLAGKNSKYNFFAVDTKCVGTLDVDCILDKESLFNKQFTTHPYVKSTTKSFGKHLLFDRTEVPILKKRKKVDVLKECGKQIEFLNGIPAWYSMDTIIEGAERPLKLIKEILNSVVETVKQINDEVPMAIPVVNNIPIPTSNSAFPANFIYDVNDVERNLFNYPVEKMANYNNWGGIVMACASSQDRAVFKVLVKACKRPGAGFTDKRAIQDKWRQWNSHTDPRYAKSFMDKWSKPWIESDKQPLWEEIDYPEAFLMNEFMKNHKNEFVHWRSILSWYDSKNTMWEPNCGKEKIYALLGHNVASRVKVYWTEKLIEDEVYLDKLKNKVSKEQLEQVTAKLFKHKKFVTLILQRLSQHAFLIGLTNTLFNTFIHHCPDIKKDIKFNLDKSTNHLFQFKNGAYNLKTGKLEARTREMYISCCLEYNYEEEINEINMGKIESVLKKILPNPILRKAQLKWRGLCLTGETKEQQFMLNLGTLASNGKSTLTNMYSNAFPIYFKAVGNDCFNINNGNAYNKCMSALVSKPIRLVGMEEWGGKLQDTEKIKKTVDGHTITCKPLYQEETTLDIQFKLEANSNTNTETESLDNGLNRRALLMEYDSKFVDNEKLVNEAKHIYLKDKSVESMLDNCDMKLAFFHLLAPYAKDYYENGLNMPDEVKDGFAKMIDEDDELKEFFDRIQINNDSNISKQEMLYHFAQFPQEKVTGNVWKQLRQECKKRGFIYDAQKEVWVEGKRKKGWFSGIEYIEPQDTEDEQDELDN